MRKEKLRRVNIAVAGLGFMGVTHLRAYQKITNARIVAVCGGLHLPENGVLRGVAGNIKKTDDGLHLGAQVKVYRRFEEMLADPEIELVDICTPTPLHTPQTIAALQAGKNVLCEKPLAGSAADGRKILKAAAAAKVFLMPAMCMRFWPGWRELKKIAVKKTYGKILAARFRRVSQMPEWGSTYANKDSGGALFDLHIHDTDFVNFLFGRPRRIFSTGVIGAHGCINHVVTQYYFPGGPAVHAEGSWLHAGGFNMAFTLLCERATLEYDFAHGRGSLFLTENGKKPRALKLQNADGYSTEIKYFVDCVARGERPQTVTARDALTALEICEAEEKSVRNGCAVKL